MARIFASCQRLPSLARSSFFLRAEREPRPPSFTMASFTMAAAAPAKTMSSKYSIGRAKPLGARGASSIPPRRRAIFSAPRASRVAG